VSPATATSRSAPCARILRTTVCVPAGSTRTRLPASTQPDSTRPA
jgi:hypothetical protein